MFNEHGVCAMLLLSLTLFKIFPSKYIWHDLGLSGHVTSPVKWPFDTPSAISYRLPISFFSYSLLQPTLHPAILEIMGPKDIEVTNLTFQPIDSPYVTSYWCLIESEALSSTVFEIFGPRNVQPIKHLDLSQYIARRYQQRRPITTN